MFDQPVDLASFTQGNISNFDHDFWIATNQTAPNLNTDFINVFGIWDVTNTNLHRVISFLMTLVVHIPISNI